MIGEFLLLFSLLSIATMYSGSSVPGTQQPGAVEEVGMPSYICSPCHFLPFDVRIRRGLYTLTRRLSPMPFLPPPHILLTVPLYRVKKGAGRAPTPCFFLLEETPQLRFLVEELW